MVVFSMVEIKRKITRTYTNVYENLCFCCARNHFLPLKAFQPIILKQSPLIVTSDVSRLEIFMKFSTYLVNFFNILH